MTMAKRKYPSEVNTRTIRIHVGAWELIRDMAAKADVPIAVIMDRLLAGEVMRSEPIVTIPANQIPMPTIGVNARTALSINGDRRIAFTIKPKGGIVIDD